MSVSKKGRRTVTVNDNRYVWYVAEDRDSPDNVLHIISDDKQLIVHFHLGQRENDAHVIVIGKKFGGVADVGHGWRRFRCPKWDAGGAITPGVVTSFVKWCLSETKDVVEVDCYGRPVPLGGLCSNCKYDLRGNVLPGQSMCPNCGKEIWTVTEANYDCAIRTEDVLALLRKRSSSKLTSIKIVAQLLDIPISEAKLLIHTSETWKDVRPRDEDFIHEILNYLEREEDEI